jgi:hypothetical protein
MIILDLFNKVNLYYSYYHQLKITGAVMHLDPNTVKQQAILTTTKWEWGKALTPLNYKSPPPLPQLAGRDVIWVNDIREAPAGDPCSNYEYDLIKSKLSVKVTAAAGDIFTLYLEKGSLDVAHPTLLAGIHLDASQRQAQAKPETHLVTFKLPFEKNFIHFKNLKPLLQANACPLVEQPKLASTVSLVESLQKRSDHAYYIKYGCIKDNKLRIVVEHSFPVIAFKLEYEKFNSTPTCEKDKTDRGYISLANRVQLHTELFALIDHNSENCTCSRKGTQNTTLEFDLTSMGLTKEETICIWGPHDTQVLGEKELWIHPNEEY